MENKPSKAFKYYLKRNFDFSTLKKVGFFPKDMKHTDYEGQAKRICTFFGFENVYEYTKDEIRCHITYAGERSLKVDEQGNLKSVPFVEVFNERLSDTNRRYDLF